MGEVMEEFKTATSVLGFHFYMYQETAVTSVLASPIAVATMIYFNNLQTSSNILLVFFLNGLKYFCNPGPLPAIAYEKPNY